MFAILVKSGLKTNHLVVEIKCKDARCTWGGQSILVNADT